MATLKGICDGIMKFKTLIVAVVAVVLTVIMLQTCQSNKNLKNQIASEKAASNQNLAAKSDSLRTYKDKYDNVGFIKPILQLSKDELKQYNPTLYAELEKELGKVVIIEKPVIQYVDSGKVKNTVAKLAENKYSLNFNYISKDKVLDIAGRSIFGAFATPKLNDVTKFDLSITPGITYLDSTSIKFGLVTGIRQDPDKIYRIFVKPSSPNIKITSLEGAAVSDYLNLKPVAEVPRRFGVGAYLGYGATIDTKNRTAAIGPSAGFAITYTIFWLGKKK